MTNEPWLGIVGHGTTGADDIERGIHLRWQFRPELGFPLGGFQLYRRPSRAGPKPLCFWFQQVPIGSVPSEILAGRDKISLKRLNGTMKVAERKLAHPLYNAAGKFFRSLPQSHARRTIKVLEPLGPRKRPSVEVKVRLPFACHEIALLFEMSTGSQVSLEAYDGSRQVDAAADASKAQAIREIHLRATAITAIVLKAVRAALIRICIRRAESCDDPDAWERLDDPVCLPVYYPGRPCKGHGTGDCDEIEVGSRLPKAPCDRAHYEGMATRDLIDALRVIVAEDHELSQAERPLPGSTEIDDCAAPGEPVPNINIPAVDALLMAAMDPVIARVLGLYYVDRPPQDTYDYKITGIWPDGTLWRLPESWTFDGMKLGRRWLNLFVAGPFKIRARTRPTIIHKPNSKLGTDRALAFLDTDESDWNFPAEFLWSRPAEADAVEIVLPEPAGEVQLYVGQDVPHVKLRARDVDGALAAPVSSTRRQEVLAAQAAGPDKLIRSVVLSGNRFWIHRIAWGKERIPHGMHCGITYGHSVRVQPKPPTPGAPTAYALPGLVQKAADCQPLGTGATRDARFSVGLQWKVPENLGSPPGDVAVRYEVIRVDEANNQESATGDTPVLIGLPADDEPAPPYKRPPGWPPDPLQFTDTGLTPGAYRYRLRAIDIFGRHSNPSEPSVEIAPKPPPPPAPAMLDAVMIERADPRLTDGERALLPVGIDEAVRIRWTWSESAERAAPDASGFQVHRVAGVPNVLEGIVQTGVSVAGEQVTATVDLEDVAAAAAQVLVGRELRQGRRAFRILSHAAGTAQLNGVRIVLKARVPPGPSRSIPVAGPCTIALEAVIPVEVREIRKDAGQLLVSLRSKALASRPEAGIIGGELQLEGERLPVTSVEGGAVFADVKSEWVSRCSVPEGANIDELADILPPLFVSLRLPPAALHKDYRKSATWDDKVGPVLPRTTAGDFTMLVRKKLVTETAGLSQPSPGLYVLLDDALLNALAVAQDRPRRQMAFGVSCLGPDNLESAVAAPALLTRTYRAPAAELEAVVNVPLNSPPPDDHVYAGAPNYAGKSSCKLKWPTTAGWAYQVYRALHDTLFKTDKSIRQETPAVGTNGRFPTNAERDTFVDSYPNHVRAAVRDLVVNPATIDRVAIEEHDYVDTLLQALASLPMNDRAFTRVNRPVKIIGAECVCEDDTLDGRAEGIYLYRVRAIGPAVNVSELGRAMAPVWVRGTSALSPPSSVIVEGGDREIRLRWRSSRDPRVRTYYVLRAEREASAQDVRLMEEVYRESADADPELRPLEVQFKDRTEGAREVVPYRQYWYRVLCVDDAGKNSAGSPIATAMAFDHGPPEEPTWLRSEWVGLDAAGVERLYDPSDVTLRAAIAIEYTTSLRDVGGLVQKEMGGSWQSISPWNQSPLEDSASGGWRYRFYDTKPTLNGPQRYRAKLLSQGGQLLESANVRTVDPP